MTTQLLSKNNSSDTSTIQDSQIRALQKAYCADQQVKYLHLEAEINLLLQKLQNLKK